MASPTVSIIRERVRQECFQSTNALGPAFYEEHLAVVADYGVRLAAPVGADPEIVELAAYLHDLSAVRDAATLPRHAALGATIAGELLDDCGYPPEKTAKVAQAIACHSTPLPIGSGDPEDVCVSNADAIAQIVRPVYWAYFVFGIRKMSCAEGRNWLRTRIENNWDGLIAPAREMIVDRCRLVRELLA